MLKDKLSPFLFILFILLIELYCFRSFSLVWAENVLTRISGPVISIKTLFIYLPLFIILLTACKKKSQVINYLPKNREHLGFLIGHVLVLLTIPFLISHYLNNSNNPYFFILQLFCLISLSIILIFHAFLDLKYIHYKKFIEDNWGIILISFFVILFTELIELSYINKKSPRYFDIGPLLFFKQTSFDILNFFNTMFFTDSFSNVSNFEIGTNRFSVIVGTGCSGIYGIRMFFIFALALFFLEKEKRNIRMPYFLLLFFAGMILSFLNNILRIFLLILIGTLGYEDYAINGFHSNLGSIFFLINISIYTLLLFSLFPIKSNIKDKPLPIHHLSLFYIMPFIVWVLLSFITHSFKIEIEWLYFIKIAVLIPILAFFFEDLRSIFKFKSIFISSILGLFIAFVWIQFSNYSSKPIALNNRLLHTNLFMCWTACKLIGTILIIPIIEELFFRGFLTRVFNKVDFWSVKLGDMNLISFLASSLAFSIIHSNYILGFFTGIFFNLILQKTKNLGDVIWAHIIANMVISIYIITYNDYRLWL